MKGGTPCMGIFPGRMHPRTHRPGVCFQKASLANYGGKFHWTLLVMTELATIVAFGKAPQSEESESTLINVLHSAALHGTCLGRMSPKNCFFGYKVKITLFNFPKNPELRKQWMQFVFLGQQQSFSQCGPVWRWICTSFDTEKWSGPSYKRSQSWFGTTDGKWNGIKCLCFVGNRRSSARHSLAPPTTRLQYCSVWQQSDLLFI